MRPARFFRLRRRRMTMVVLTLLMVMVAIALRPESYTATTTSSAPVDSTQSSAADTLAQLPVKGRAPSTGYARTQFGDGWQSIGVCDMRNVILARDLRGIAVSPDCKVLSGTLSDPYTGDEIVFTRGADTSDDVQIDHVVALSDAWQTGAQQLSYDRRVALANDPLELLAVDGQANQNKGGSNAASWLPPNKLFRCQYVARQIAVKAKYQLWVTAPERDAMNRILTACPGQALPASGVDTPIAAQ